MGAAVKLRSAHVVTLFDGGDGGELGFIELIVAVREHLKFSISPSCSSRVHHWLHCMYSPRASVLKWDGDAAHGQFDFPAYRTQTNTREGTHMLRAWKHFRTRMY